MGLKRPTDITTFLWKNICDKLGMDAPTLDRVQKELKVPRGNLQRIKGGGMPTSKSLNGIAEALGVELWELLVPPGEALAKSDDVPMEQAVEMFTKALGGLSPAKRGLVLQHVALYAEDPKNEESSLAFVLGSLGGGGDQKEQLRQVG